MREGWFRLGVMASVGALGCAPDPPRPSVTPVPLSEAERAMLGCYEATVGAWREVASGRPSTGAYIAPPRRMVFDSVEVSRDRDGRPRRRVLFDSNTEPGRRPAHFQSWQLSGRRDSVYVRFSTGFSGVALRLGGRPDSLVGTAHDFWDFEATDQVAPATLTRIACSGVPIEAPRDGAT